MTPPIYELGPDFYDSVKPAHFPEQKPRFLNQEKARFLHFKDQDWKTHLCEFQPLLGNLLEPLALRYHGHQFQSYNPDLGDGRGFLFAQLYVEGRWLDLGTKGSGTTPYSRQGDGRLTLKGALRETLATEMLESLGVNTSKTFCFFETGENLIRHDEPSPTRSAVLTRLSHSHIRFGTFQRLAFLQQTENIRKLVSYVVRHYDPEILNQCEPGDQKEAELFLKSAVKKSAALSAQWMIAGFVHGVLNTDNMSITGESFDYGPYRFLPTYDPYFTAAYFDQSGLYSYGRQPYAVFWNLQQLVQAVQSAYNNLNSQDILSLFEDHFHHNLKQRFLSRLNLKEVTPEKTMELLGAFFSFLEKTKNPFEETFFDLCSAPIRSHRWQKSVYQSLDFLDLKVLLRQHSLKNESLAVHSYLDREQPITLLYPEIEALWAPISEFDDWSLFYRKIEEIRSFRGLYDIAESDG